MPVDFTLLEPDGLQVHIKLNTLLSRYGFFETISSDQKREFDLAFQKIISVYLPYDDDADDGETP